MKKNNVLLFIYFISAFYSTKSLAIVECSSENHACNISSGDTFDESSYKAVNGNNINIFTGGSAIDLYSIDSSPLSNVTVTGLYYEKFNVDSVYNENHPFPTSLKTPQFNILTSVEYSTLEKSVFSVDGADIKIEHNDIINAIIFPRFDSTEGNTFYKNTITNGQVIISNGTFIELGYFYPNYPSLTNIKITENTYNGSSDEIIISDSIDNEKLSSSGSKFNDTSSQYLSGIVSTENPTFNGKSTQILKNNSVASGVTLNGNSRSTVYNSAEQTGTTNVNGSAQLTLITGSDVEKSSGYGASAENVKLNDDESSLNIVFRDSNSSGNIAFVGAIEGKGKVLFETDKQGNYSHLIAGNVSGSNRYAFDVDIKNGKGSLLTINDSSSGNHIANANNDGAADTNGKEKITIIEDKSGTNAKATFESDKPIELGGYTYTVERDSENANNWVVVGKKTENGGSTINDTAKSITGLASSSYLLNQAELTTLRQRMGDLTTDKVTSSDDISGVWGRIYGGRYKTRDNANLAELSMNYYGFQLGGDGNTIKEGDNKNYLGAFVGHTTGKPNFDRGDSTVESWYGGLYNTFITEDKFYVDSVFKFGQYRNKYNFNDSQDNALNGKVNSNVLTLSSEIGKRFILTTNDTYNLYLEPQAQLTWSRIGSFKTSASNGLSVRQDAYNSLISRLGVLLGSQINKESDIYLKTSYLHEFKNDVNYKLNNSGESYNVQGNGVEIGVGGNIKLNENGYLYLEANYINSHAHYTGSKFNVGYRYSF